MAFSLIEALVIAGVNRMTAGRIEAACYRVHAGEETRRRLAQCAARGIADKDDIYVFSECAGLIGTPAAAIKHIAQTKRMSFSELCEWIGHDT